MSTEYNFDATTVAPSTGSSSNLPVSPPEGWSVQIVNVEMKQTSSKEGHYAEFTLQIVDGEHVGTQGAYRLNLGNQNEQAVHIAHSQLSSLCHVTGVMQMTDLMQLANIPFRAVVVMQTVPQAVEKGYTEVKLVLDINGNKPGQQSAPNPNAPPAGAPQFQPPAAAAPPVAAAPPAVAPPAQQFAVEQGAPQAPAPAATPAAWPPTGVAQAPMQPPAGPPTGPPSAAGMQQPAPAPPSAAGKAPWLAS